jgi:uncharacterized protein YejL (UPF0352 family)
MRTSLSCRLAVVSLRLIVLGDIVAKLTNFPWTVSLLNTGRLLCNCVLVRTSVSQKRCLFCKDTAQFLQKSRGQRV